MRIRERPGQKNPGMLWVVRQHAAPHCLLLQGVYPCESRGVLRDGGLTGTDHHGPNIVDGVARVEVLSAIVPGSTMDQPSDPWRMTLLMYSKSVVKERITDPKTGLRRTRTAMEISTLHASSICKAIEAGGRPVLAVMESNEQFMRVVASANDPIPALHPDGTRLTLGDHARMRIMRNKQRAILAYYTAVKRR